MDQLKKVKTAKRRTQRKHVEQKMITLADIEELLSNGGSLLSAGSQFEGNMESDYTIHVNTNFYGNIFSRQAIVIGRAALVKGDFEAPLIVVFGEVHGALYAQKIILQDGAKIKGELHCDELLQSCME